MLSGSLDVVHDVLVILLSLAGQILNIIITYLLHAHGWTTYYRVSLAFVIVGICSQSILFTVRFAPRHPIRCGSNAKCSCLKSICHPLLYLVLSSAIAPLTSLITFFTERHLRTQIETEGKNTSFIDYEQLNRIEYRKQKYVRKYGCVYIQYHETSLNQWMHFKFAKHIGFMLQVLTETLPHFLIQLTFLIKKVSNGKHAELESQSLLAMLQLSICIAVLSLMSKTFIFGYGINNKLYIHSWMCYFTDFLHILFVILFLFVSTRDAVVWTYLPLPTADTVFATIYMHLFSYVLVPLATMAAFGVIGTLFIEFVGSSCSDATALMFCVCCPCALAVYLVLVSGILCMVLPLLVALNTTVLAGWAKDEQSRFKYVTRLEVNEMVNFCVEFINHSSTSEEMKLYSYPENDRVMRILSVNRAYHSLELDAYGSKYKDDKFVKYLVKIAAEHSWQQVTEASIGSIGYGSSEHCLSASYKHKYLNEYLDFVRIGYETLFKARPSYMSSLECICFCCFCSIPYVLAFILLTGFHLLLAAFWLSRLLVILYPVFVLVNASDFYGVHWFILIVFIVFYMTSLVMQYRYAWPTLDALYMIPGIARSGSKVNLIVNSVAPDAFRQKVHAYYGIVQLTKYVQEVLQKRFGDDVALIIVEYAFEDWMKKK